MSEDPPTPSESDEAPEPTPPYPEEYLEGLRLFNDRQFWECHEAIEQVWLPVSDGPKDFYQGIIQTAGGFVHLTKTGHWHGAKTLWRKARDKIARYRPRYAGLDTAWLHEHLCSLVDRAERIHEGELEPDAVGEADFFELWPDDAEVEKGPPVGLEFD